MTETDIAIPSDPMKEFRERVTAKLREDIGAMLPDEALAVMVQQAVRDQFFKPRITKHQFRDDIIEPSWFVAEVTKTAAPIIKAIVEKYAEDHHDVVEKAVHEFLTDKHLAFLAFAALRISTTEDFSMMANEIIQRLQQGR